MQAGMPLLRLVKKAFWKAGRYRIYPILPEVNIKQENRYLL
jgi:hypothetical protein